MRASTCDADVLSEDSESTDEEREHWPSPPGKVLIKTSGRHSIPEEPIVKLAPIDSPSMEPWIEVVRRRDTY